jgi:hypothetical protein
MTDAKDYKDIINNEMSEADFQSIVIKAAQTLRWKVSHFRGVRVQRANGSFYYQTPVQADGSGFPDLVMVKPPYIIFAELKKEKNKTSDSQKEWLGLLNACTGAGKDYEATNVFVRLWRPRDWDEIVKLLSIS